MGIVEIFERFAADFELSVADDDWSRLAKYLADDATYLNVGGPDPKCQGRAAILTYLKEDISSYDRRFDTRKLAALAPPTADGNRLRRRWRCTYTLAGAPDLVVDGEARYLFDGDLIKEIEEEATRASMRKVEEWAQKYGDGLRT